MFRVTLQTTICKMVHQYNEISVQDIFGSLVIFSLPLKFNHQRLKKGTDIIRLFIFRTHKLYPFIHLFTLFTLFLQIVALIRDHGGRKNLAKKTLVDERFLIQCYVLQSQLCLGYIHVYSETNHDCLWEHSIHLCRYFYMYLFLFYFGMLEFSD